MRWRKCPSAAAGWRCLCIPKAGSRPRAMGGSRAPECYGFGRHGIDYARASSDGRSAATASPSQAQRLRSRQTWHSHSPAGRPPGFRRLACIGNPAIPWGIQSVPRKKVSAPTGLAMCSATSINHSAQRPQPGNQSVSAGSRSTTAADAGSTTVAGHPQAATSALTRPGGPSLLIRRAGRAWVPRRERPAPAPHISRQPLAQRTEIGERSTKGAGLPAPTAAAGPFAMQPFRDWATQFSWQADCSMDRSARRRY